MKIFLYFMLKYHKNLYQMLIICLYSLTLNILMSQYKLSFDFVKDIILLFDFIA